MKQLDHKHIVPQAICWRERRRSLICSTRYWELFIETSAKNWITVHVKLFEGFLWRSSALDPSSHWGLRYSSLSIPEKNLSLNLSYVFLCYHAYDTIIIIYYAFFSYILLYFQYVETPIGDIKQKKRNGENNSWILVDDVDVLDLGNGCAHGWGAALQLQDQPETEMWEKFIQEKLIFGWLYFKL